MRYIHVRYLSTLFATEFGFLCNAKHSFAQLPSDTTKSEDEKTQYLALVVDASKDVCKIKTHPS